MMRSGEPLRIVVEVVGVLLLVAATLVISGNIW